MSWDSTAYDLIDYSQNPCLIDSSRVLCQMILSPHQFLRLPGLGLPALEARGELKSSRGNSTRAKEGGQRTYICVKGRDPFSPHQPLVKHCQYLNQISDKYWRSNCLSIWYSYKTKLGQMFDKYLSKFCLILKLDGQIKNF